ncbi:hypothetical protein [Methylobacterium sp. WL6]|uniref:hypothetical protein n=1 Tax=Methylobacterium sp. WL6 TaxID=2603901 RepID=UPI0011C9AAF3|nr:hypothetical protein [Methylobacterium sp. WL6]TXN71591.1 hypothetical protein FV230_07915 [Methylobacterium sp. WL6]
MSDFARPSLDNAMEAKGTLAQLSVADFVKGWRAIVGEPPSIMLDDRSEMIKHLIEGVPAAVLDPAAALTAIG